MNLISLVGASKDFGIRSLFKDLDLHIQEKDRLGLIGPNGTGKSTLLKVLAGLEPIEAGERRCSPKTSIELVDQQSLINPGQTVLEAVLAGCGAKSDLLIRFYNLSNKVAESPSDKKLLSALSQLTLEMDEAKVWSLEQQCKEILQRLGINDLQCPVEELSGGYLKRISLASSLVAQPDVLLLDEPTNHLDAITVEWLQAWLGKYPGALVLITHDRYVLDRVTQRMIEIDQGKSLHFEGNYSNYLVQKAEKDKSEASSKIKLKNILRKELNWLRQGAKARSTKQKARIKRIDKMNLEASDKKNTITSSVQIAQVNRRIGKKVIQADSLTIEMKTNQGSLTLIENFNYSFTPDDRVGIIGPNGSGKTTLLDLIAGLKQPSKGSLQIGETVHIGYLDQYNTLINEYKNLNKKVIDFVKEAATIIEIRGSKITASQLLERFLFTPAQQHSQLAKLSGGEKRRLALCRMLIQAPNVLLLDEPTNDLDVNTLSVLEDFLEDFQGCVVVVSHDRYFLDRTVNRILSIEASKLKQYEGNYSAFLEKKRFEEQKLFKKKLHLNTYEISKSEPKKGIHKLESSNKSFRSSKRPQTNSLRRSFNQTKELESLERNLPVLEARQKALEKDIAKNNGDLLLLSQELADLVQTIKKSEDRWLELSELLD